MKQEFVSYKHLQIIQSTTHCTSHCSARVFSKATVQATVRDFEVYQQSISHPHGTSHCSKRVLSQVAQLKENTVKTLHVEGSHNL